METGLFLYTPNELLSTKHKGIPGFIDERGLADLQFIQDALGTPVMIAAGRCPNCGNIQMTIYANFKTTNCLKCGYELDLSGNQHRKQQFLHESGTVDVEYEEVIEEHDFNKINYNQVGKSLYCINVEKAELVWPVVKQNPWHKRYLNVIKQQIKTLWKPTKKKNRKCLLMKK